MKALAVGDGPHLLHQLLEQLRVVAVEPYERDRQLAGGGNRMRRVHAAAFSAVEGAASRTASSACSARRPRWCRPWTELSVRPRWVAISPGVRPDDVAQHDHGALLLGQGGERLLHAVRAVDRGVVDARVGLVDLLGRRRAARAQVVDRRVVGEPHEPGEERDGALVVLDDDRHQLREHVLGDVLGLVLVAHDAAHVAVDVVGVLHVEEADGFPVALLGPGDGLRDDAVAVARPRPRSCWSGSGRPPGWCPVRRRAPGMRSIMREVPSVLVLCIRAVQAAAKTGAVARRWRGRAR